MLSCVKVPDNGTLFPPGRALPCGMAWHVNVRTDAVMIHDGKYSENGYIMGILIYIIYIHILECGKYITNSLIFGFFGTPKFQGCPFCMAYPRWH